MSTDAIHVAGAAIGAAAGEEKCRPCGCFHHALEALAGLDPALDPIVDRARARARSREYACQGCSPCGPAVALSDLADAGHAVKLEEACLSEAAPGRRSGWPPLPGNFRVLRYRAPVAVCTLTDEGLMEEIAWRAGSEVAIVGTLETENLGIERIVSNVTANPEIRRLVVCGADSRREVGHRPGASLLALSANGIDADRRIVGAPGKRPVLRNVMPLVVSRFCERVEVVDLVDRTDVEEILAAAVAPGRGGGVAAPPSEPDVPRIDGWIPERTVPDPAGWFVVHLDRAADLLVLEHYTRDGTLSLVVTGRTAPECWFPVVERGLVTRLDHAAYLGRELTRAERALLTGAKYVQDSAPERECGC